MNTTLGRTAAADRRNTRSIGCEATTPKITRRRRKRTRKTRRRGRHRASDDDEVAAAETATHAQPRARGGADEDYTEEAKEDKEEETAGDTETTPAVLTAITCMLVVGHGGVHNTQSDEQPTTTSLGLAGGKEERHE